MGSRLSALAVLVVLFVVAGSGGTQGPAAAVKVPAPPAAKDQPEPERAKTAADIRKRLNEPSDKLKSGIDAGTPLRDALEHISKLYGVTIRINEVAFRYEGDVAVAEKPVQVPPTRDVPLRIILQELLGQLEPVPGTYLVRGSYLEVTTYSQALMFSYPVDAKFKNRPLEEALDELSDQTGITIVLDIQTGKKGKKPVTADFRDVSVWNATRMLADMAGLKAVKMANGIYVTSRTNADILDREERAREERDENAYPFFIRSVGGPIME